MLTRQVSVFMENQPGRLLRLLTVLAEANVNLWAHNIVDATDFGIIHLIVDDPGKAERVVRMAGITCSTVDVLQVTVPNEPGGLMQGVLLPLAEAGVNIEYSYAFSGAKQEQAYVVLKVDDAARGWEVLGQS